MAKDKLSASEIADLVDSIGPALLAFAGVSSPISEDIVQEAFCRLVRESNTIESPQAWLFTVVRNLVRQEYRSKSRRLKREKLVATPVVQLSALEFNADSRLAADTLSQLPDELREVVTLRLWGDMTFEEVAEVTQTSISTVYRRYSQAIEILKRKLGNVTA